MQSLTTFTVLRFEVYAYRLQRIFNWVLGPTAGH